MTESKLTWEEEWKLEGLREGKLEGLREGELSGLRKALSLVLKVRSTTELPQWVEEKLAQAEAEDLLRWIERAVQPGASLERTLT